MQLIAHSRLFSIQCQPHWRLWRLPSQPRQRVADIKASATPLNSQSLPSELWYCHHVSAPPMDPWDTLHVTSAAVWFYDCNVCVDTCSAQPCQLPPSLTRPNFHPDSRRVLTRLDTKIGLAGHLISILTKQGSQTIWDNNILTIKDCWSQRNLRHLLVMSWRSGNKNCLVVSIQHYGGAGRGPTLGDGECFVCPVRCGPGQ